MEQSVYYISEAAQKVHVESHVLRYWEDELQLPIQRNEMGHRCYTEENITQLREIKEWKEQGLQLKAIRSILESKEKEGEQNMDKVQKYMVSLSKDPDPEKTVIYPVRKEAGAEEKENALCSPNETGMNEKAARLQLLLQHMITDAVKTANRELCTDVKDSILKELDYQFRMQEERDDARWKQEEEHYRRIDEMIRERHGGREKTKKEKKKSPISF